MAKHEYYVVQGKTLDNIAETMKTVLGVDKDTPIRFDEITNNEKVEQVTENVDAQAEVIEQIKAALNGKSSIGVKEIMDIIDQSGVLDSTDGTATEKVEQLIDKASNFTAGFTSEKYKQWLEINGYTIVNFTLTSQATADFIINHPLGRTAKSIICFRADLSDEISNKRIGFAVSLDGSTADVMTNRLVRYENIYMPFVFGIKVANLDYRAILENTTEHIKLRYVSGTVHGLIWESGDYYLAVL